MAPDSAPNPLRAYFEAHRGGRGIHKWLHYFDAYDRHLERFRGTDVHLLEIGIGSGGSLEMWREYFGPAARIFGVDVRQECSAFAGERVAVFVGDQADRGFWASFRAAVPRLDVVLDDGGHEPEQQRVSFEELFPHLRAGGVYIVEDVHGAKNEFERFVLRYARRLNFWGEHLGHKARATNAVQRDVHSVSLYPFLVVFEKTREPVLELVPQKRGTEWLRPPDA